MIFNKRNGKLIAKEVIYATNYWRRTIGLMGRKKLQEQSAFVIYPCKQIHTFFMRFSIDCVFIDENCNVIKLYDSIKPWRICQKVPQAYGVIELPAGTIKRTFIKAHDKLHFTRGQQNEV